MALRLLGCNARELGVPGGKEARCPGNLRRKWHSSRFAALTAGADEESARSRPRAGVVLRTLLPVGTKVVLRSVQDDKYGGRYGAMINAPGLGDITAAMLAAGYAAPWDGNGPALPAFPALTT